jgi:hypothetical protein
MQLLCSRAVLIALTVTAVHQYPSNLLMKLLHCMRHDFRVVTSGVSPLLVQSVMAS